MSNYLISFDINILVIYCSLGLYLVIAIVAVPGKFKGLINSKIDVADHQLIESTSGQQTLPDVRDSEPGGLDDAASNR